MEHSEFWDEVIDDFLVRVIKNKDNPSNNKMISIIKQSSDGIINKRIEISRLTFGKILTFLNDVETRDAR